MSLLYVIKEGIAGFKRARLASFTSAMALMVTVLLLGIIARLAFNAYQVARSLKNTVEVEVFLKDIPDSQIQTIRQKLAKQTIVKDITYISKDSAAVIFRKEFGAEASAMADLKFLPASFKLRLNDDVPVASIDKMISDIKTYDGVDDISFNEQLLKLLQTRIRTLLIAGGGLMAIILLISMLLVFNTIRLTIYAKRDLIKAMKLVGATNGFIRRPFLVEGLLQGILSGGFSAALLYALFQYIIPHYIPQFGVLDWPFSRWYYLVGGMILMAMLMGFFGSRWAARKFIKEASISG